MPTFGLVFLTTASHSTRELPTRLPIFIQSNSSEDVIKEEQWLIGITSNIL
jgi:hypothetical protein